MALVTKHHTVKAFRRPRRLSRKLFRQQRICSSKVDAMQRAPAGAALKRKAVLAELPSAEIGGKNLLQVVIGRLQLLSADASWQEIRQTVNAAVAETLPQEVVNRAITVFDSERKALSWLVSNNLALGGLSPKEYIEQKDGVDEVLTVLGRIEYGVYS